MNRCFGAIVRKVAAAEVQCLQLWHTFGWRILVLLAANFTLVKGAGYFILAGVQLPFFQLIHVSAAEFATLGNVANTAWALLPVVGIMSDMLPIVGKRRTVYLILYAAAGCAALVTLAILPERNGTDKLAAILFFFGTLAVAALGLLYQGKYTELMVSQGSLGLLLASYVQVVYYIGMAAGAGIEGPVAQYLNPRTCLWIIAPLFLIQVPPLLLGWLDEKVVPLHTVCNREQIEKKKHLLGLSLLLSAVALAVMMIQIYETTRVQLLYASVGSVVVIAASVAVLPHQIAKACVFLFLKNVSWVSIGSILSYWYTSPNPCVVDGPDFSYTYYQTYAGVVSNIAPIGGVLLFQAFLSRKKFFFAFVVTTLIKLISAIFDITMVRRWNVSVFGVSDDVMYMLGDAVTQPLCYMLAYMPMTLLMSRLCPKGVESTLFGLLSGFENLGQTVAVIIGVYAAEQLAINTGSGSGSSEACNWDHLTTLIVIAHVFAPLLAIPAAYFLLPDTVIAEDIREVIVSFLSDREKSVISEKWAEDDGERTAMIASERTVNSAAPFRDDDDDDLDGGQPQSRIARR